MNEIELTAGTIRYRDTGNGPPVVFVHGLLVDGTLWRKVTPALEDRFRCIVPDLPLGSHTIPMRPDADLTPPGQAALIGELIEALDLRDVTLVANDSGGALTQILVASGRTERIGRIVLTPCDSFDTFFPPLFRPLQKLAQLPGGVSAALKPLRARRLRRLPVAYGWLTKRPVPDDVTDGWLKACLSDPAIRRDTAKFVSTVDSKHTLAAARHLHSFDRPVLLAWAPEDRFFPLEHARKLAALFPDARIEEIADSYTFVSEDQPERLARLVGDFAAQPVETPANAR